MQGKATERWLENDKIITNAMPQNDRMSQAVKQRSAEPQVKR